jgi:hypothetical protein
LRRFMKLKDKECRQVAIDLQGHTITGSTSSSGIINSAPETNIKSPTARLRASLKIST